MNSNYNNQSDLRIVHISPKYFTKETIGGGERYPFELSKALSKYANVTLIAFGNTEQTNVTNKAAHSVQRENTKKNLKG